MHFSSTHWFYLFKEDSRTTKCFLVEPLWDSKPPSFLEKYTKIYKNFQKSELFSFFCQFRCEFDAFFQNKLLLPFQKSPRTTNCFLVERLWDSKSSRFEKNTQKLKKIFTNLNFFVFFCQFCCEFDAFFQHTLVLPLQKSPRTKNYFLVERLWDSKSSRFGQNTQKLNKIFKNLNFFVFFLSILL